MDKDLLGVAAVGLGAYAVGKSSANEADIHAMSNEIRKLILLQQWNTLTDSYKKAIFTFKNEYEKLTIALKDAESKKKAAEVRFLSENKTFVATMAGGTAALFFVCFFIGFLITVVCLFVQPVLAILTGGASIILLLLSAGSSSLQEGNNQYTLLLKMDSSIYIAEISTAKNAVIKIIADKPDTYSQYVQFRSIL